MGCDTRQPVRFRAGLNFNPRTPRGVRRFAGFAGFAIIGISIHAPRVGCDQFHDGTGANLPNFNPRTPRGVRRRVDGLYR